MIQQAQHIFFVNVFGRDSIFKRNFIEDPPKTPLPFGKVLQFLLVRANAD